ncbi:hypothetical protein AAFC00_007074 [Neodothiora populina]|uniref:WD40 repeat-like protein n=1 Tax=Neodothiora populina TaxID=2781224 RepID=A0ABR3PC69_9PEZI
MKQILGWSRRCHLRLGPQLRSQKPPTATRPDEKAPPLPTTTFRRQVQAHTHWINDILLTQQNQALVSASSDISVKLWRPAGTDALPPQTIGLHNDYVKVLASPDQNADWVASGGLDRKIKFWDISGAGQRLSIDVGLEEGASGLGRDKGSIYALAATNSIIASGGPESTVRIWDPRTGKRVTKFVGHTDNVRDILISHDGSTVMTASSDETVKLWSVIAGRCMNTFTMHDASVWSLWSDHPQLSVFWSSDKSGLIAKTDTRGCAELEDGLSVAVAQEHQGVHKIIASGDFLWTGTSRPSINRWRDVNTDGAEVESPEGVLQSHRMSTPTAKPRLPSPLYHSSPPQSPMRERPSGGNKIASKHILRLSNTVYVARAQRPPTRDNATEAEEEPESEVMVPVRSAPESHVEGQNGLIQHHMLSDRRRVLTLDTAGEVMMWDIIKCAPVKSYGKRHIEDVAPEVNTFETVPNWCSIDTRTGSLTITLEENNAFDAEMYADELDPSEQADFKEDQRINLGKWVLRYLFAGLVDVEVLRDQQIRRHLLDKATMQKFERENAPPSIQLPMTQTNGFHDTTAPLTATTLKAGSSHGSSYTPGLSIGAATPGGFFGSSPIKKRDSDSEDGAPLSKTTSQQSRKSGDSKDYFSTATTATAGLTSPTETIKAPVTPGEVPAEGSDAATALPGETPSKFGRKFKMNMSFGMKKLGRTTTNEAAKPAVIEDACKESEAESDTRSVKTDNSRVVEENFLGCIQKIRFGYEDDLTAQAQRQNAMESAGGALGAAKDLELPSQVTPSSPSETPVLRPPPNTTILIQEDSPEAGGVADLWEGKVGVTGEAAQVELLEKYAPMWLGDVLLKNQIPYKDVVKISFVLEPLGGELPPVATEGNNRLNANRMLRARKILTYVAERIEPGYEAPSSNNAPAAAAATATAVPSNVNAPAQVTSPTTAISAPIAVPSAAASRPSTATSPTFSSNNPYARFASLSTSDSQPALSSSFSTQETRSSSSSNYDDDRDDEDDDEDNPFAHPDDDVDDDHHHHYHSPLLSSSQHQEEEEEEEEEAASTPVPTRTFAQPSSLRTTAILPPPIITNPANNDQASILRPEDYLELYCNHQAIPPKMTLATIRSHLWKAGGDVVLSYKANGRKKIVTSSVSSGNNAGLVNGGSGELARADESSGATTGGAGAGTGEYAGNGTSNEIGNGIGSGD